MMQVSNNNGFNQHGNNEKWLLSGCIMNTKSPITCNLRNSLHTLGFIPESRQKTDPFLLLFLLPFLVILSPYLQNNNLQRKIFCLDLLGSVLSWCNLQQSSIEKQKIYCVISKDKIYFIVKPILIGSHNM